MAAVLCLVFYTVLLVELPVLNIDSTENFSRRHLRDPQKKVEFGLWDEHLTISRLQLTVVLSMSLHADEETVSVLALDDHFFSVIVTEGEWLVAAINEDTRFLAKVNRNARIFGAELVVSHPARARLNVNITR